MADKTYKQKEFERILQENGQVIHNKNDIIDSAIVDNLAKEQGFSYDKDFDIWKEPTKTD